MVSEPLIAWVKAREALRIKKERGDPPPWTDDPILNQFRFCNVRRKDDRVSRWLRSNILLGDNLNNFKSFIEFTAFCRWNNWPPTIQEILDAKLYPVRSINWQAIENVVEDRKGRKEKAWTGAYIIKAPDDGSSKTAFVASICRDIGANLRPEYFNGSRREIWERLIKVKYVGSFMAGQVVDDWGWTLLLSGARDTATWAPMGPGSIRGHNRLLGLPLKQRPKAHLWSYQLQIWYKDIIAALGRQYADLTLHDVQNCLCEFDKYERTRMGEGRPRSMYRPETAFT